MIEPQLKFEEFFNGPIKAWGIVQNRAGNVTRRFEVDMMGRWEGNQGTLEEHFTYYDGEKQERTWIIDRLADGQYEGRASDIVGKATGNSEGSAIKWKYVMKLPVGGRTYDVTFDDRMFLMQDGVLINRSYLKKFGFEVAQLTIFMQRQ